jgi:hypothetical protein
MQVARRMLLDHEAQPTRGGRGFAAARLCGFREIAFLSIPRQGGRPQKNRI